MRKIVLSQLEIELMNKSLDLLEGYYVELHRDYMIKEIKSLRLRLNK